MRRPILIPTTSMPLFRIAASIVSLALPVALLAGDASTIVPGTYVRVSTGTEVGSGTLEPTADGTTVRPLAHDKRTTTFEVKGQPVRVAKPGVTIEGILQTIDTNTLTLQREGDAAIVVSRAAIRSVDVRKRESKKGIGAGIGLLAGGAIGYAIGAATSGPGCQGGETGFAALCSLDEIGKPAGAILGVLSGAVLGAIVAPGSRWEKNVPLDHVRLSLGPTRGRGLGWSVSVAF
jgi:hypothetical protein